MKKKHDRKFGLCATDLARIRFRVNEMELMSQIQNEIEELLVKSNFLKSAPFEWITLSLRFGTKNDEIPQYQGISREYGDLALAIELDADELVIASSEKLRLKFMLATLKSLIHAGEKYYLPTEILQEQLSKLSE